MIQSHKMLRIVPLAPALAVILGVLAPSPAIAFDPYLVVSWDEVPAPVLNVDYIVSTGPPASPDFPDVELIAGSLTWEIWSIDTDNPDLLGDIGVISCPHADNFAVSIRSDFDASQFGARNVKAITLAPSSSSNYSNITEARIAGGVVDDVTVQADFSGIGGEVSLTTSGAVTADMTIHKANNLSIPAEVSGTIMIDELTDNGLHIGILSGSVKIGTADTVVRIFNSISGSVDISEMTNGFTVFFPSGVSQTGALTFGDVVGPSIMDIGVLGGGEVAGTIQFLHGVPEDLTANIEAELTSTGVVDLNDMGVAGLLALRAGGEGTVINGGAVTGSVELGTLYESGPLTFSGTATFAGVEYGGQIVTDLSVPPVPIDGQLNILNVLNGNLCAANLNPATALPSNITIGCGIGASGTICGGEQVCPVVAITDADPLDGTRDARQPHPPGDNSMGARQGIGSPNEYTEGPEPITLTLDSATEGAINHECWTLCETRIEQTEGDPLDPNQLECVTDMGDGVYKIRLERPISAGHWTTIAYEGDGSYVTYSSLPADANDNGTSASSDLLVFIDCCLNQICTPAHGDYTCDANHSGAVTFSDYLRMVDLLNGAGTFIEWNSTSVASNTCPGESESAMMGPGSGDSVATESETALYMNHLVGLLQRLRQNDRIDESALIELVVSLADVSVKILAPDERIELADRLSDASLTFASATVAEMIPDVVGTLLGTY